MSRIFISYRREDTGHVAGRVHDWIGRRFGDDNVFRDIDNIEPGEDFVVAIQQAISSCDGVIVLIGKQWASEHCLQRLHNPQDFVRLEIATSLERNVRTIPVLVDGTEMPNGQQLPSDIQALSRRQAQRLTDASFRDDIGRLIGVLERVLGSSTGQEVRPRNENNQSPEHPEAGSRSPSVEPDVATTAVSTPPRQISTSRCNLVVRRRFGVNGALTSWGVCVNDTVVGSIGNGETKTFEIPAGSFSVQLKWGRVLGVPTIGQSSEILKFGGISQGQTVSIACEHKTNFGLLNGIKVFRIKKPGKSLQIKNPTFVRLPSLPHCRWDSHRSPAAVSTGK